jgi:hypothetical protein
VVTNTTHFSNCLPGTQAQNCPHDLQTRRICISLSENRNYCNRRSTRHKCGAGPKPHERKIKSREGLTLWLRVLSLLSQREEELIETTSELWPPALRRRLASALDHRERSRSRSSPFRNRFFRPGIKVHQQLRIRDLSAVNQLETHNSGI